MILCLKIPGSEENTVPFSPLAVANGDIGPWALVMAETLEDTTSIFYPVVASPHTISTSTQTPLGTDWLMPVNSALPATTRLCMSLYRKLNADTLRGSYVLSPGLCT